MSTNIEKDNKKELYEEKKRLKAEKKLAKAKEESSLSKTLKNYIPSIINWVFFFTALVVLALGALVVNKTLLIKEDAFLVGSIPDIFGWILITIGVLTVLYSIYPIFLPAFPELKRISWLKGKPYIGNTIRVFIFLILFASLFLLYDTLITEVLKRILG